VKSVSSNAKKAVNQVGEVAVKATTNEIKNTVKKKTDSPNP
jgi:hypothetical protein